MKTEKTKLISILLWLHDVPFKEIKYYLNVSQTSIYKWARQRDIKKKCVEKYKN